MGWSFQRRLRAEGRIKPYFDVRLSSHMSGSTQDGPIAAGSLPQIFCYGMQACVVQRRDNVDVVV